MKQIRELEYRIVVIKMKSLGIVNNHERESLKAFSFLKARTGNYCLLMH